MEGEDEDDDDDEDENDTPPPSLNYQLPRLSTTPPPIYQLLRRILPRSPGKEWRSHHRCGRCGWRRVRQQALNVA